MTEGIFVLDTSVIVKWFRQEEVLANEALRWRMRYLDGDIAVVVPALVAYELANVLRFKTDLSTAQVQRAMDSIFDMGFQWASPTSDIIHRTVEIAREYEITIYDGVFVATAEALGAVVITADERLCRRVSDSDWIRFLGDSNQPDGTPSTK